MITLPTIETAFSTRNHSNMRPTPVSSQSPQASASTNSAIRAEFSETSVADEECPETVGESSADHSKGSDTRTPDSGGVTSTKSGCTDSMARAPTSKELEIQRLKLKAQRARVYQTFGAPTPQRIPPYLSFQCVEIDMSQFRSGVYMLVRDNRVVYVGSSIEVINRVGSHRIGYARKQFDRAFFLPCQANERLEIEGALIRFFLPEYNSVPHAPPYTDQDDQIRRWLRLPNLHPEMRKLYRERMKMTKMNREAMLARHPNAPRRPGDKL